MSGHTHETYGDFSHFEITHDSTTITTLSCTLCNDEILEWQIQPVNVADLIKAMSQHETDMDRAP